MNAHFNMIDRALNGANSRRDLETSPTCGNGSSARTAILRGSGRAISFLRQLRSILRSVARGCSVIPTDFLWQRSPFQLDGGGSGLIESAGIDYILPYWMARYYNVVRD